MIYHYIYITTLVILALMLFACLIRAVRGPRVADRIVAVNMMGTMVMVMIAVLALMLNDNLQLAKNLQKSAANVSKTRSK